MQDVTIRCEIDRILDSLNPEMQKKVLDYITLLCDAPSLPGVPGKSLSKHAGTLSREEGDELIGIIEEGCGQIDYNEW
ncbi:MAG: hypothetical protein GY765_09175 [bacterium]|nr:hypothetical protein [bacterium]